MRSRPRRATIPPIWPHCGRLIRLLPTAAGRRWQRKRLEIFQRDRWRVLAERKLAGMFGKVAALGEGEG